MARNETKITADFTDLGRKMFEDSWNIWSTFGARVSGLALDAVETSNGIVSRSTQETVDNARALADMRSEPAEMAKAYGEFAQKQAEIARRAAEEFATVFQTAATGTTEAVSETGQKVADTAAANANAATDKAKKAA